MEKGLVHDMVPKHEIITEKKAAELLKQFNISKTQLPTILMADPALKGLEVKNEDIIRITRENPVIGTSYAFRVVVAL